MEFTEHPFFEQVNSDQIAELAEIAVFEEHSPDKIIFEEGSPSEGLFLVLEGEVAFCKRLEEDKFRVIGRSKAGTFFGEVGLFTGQPRALRAESRGKVVLAKIPKDELIKFMKSTPGPIEHILQSIINHLHETTRHYMVDMLQQEKMAVVGTMVNTIIHDFKNPFCLISLGAQLMMQMHTDEKTQKFCQNIEDQIQRMVEMAEELTDFSRGEQDLKFTEVNLSKMFKDFRELNILFFQNDKINIEIDIPEIVIEGEERKLLRVFQNLVGNAIEAFGDKEGHISVKGEIEKGDTLLVRITDNGNGIPPEIQAHFWEPFVTHGKRKGTGLGSAIAKSIVEGHGGSIEYETEQGKGTVFYVRLPVTQSLPG